MKYIETILYIILGILSFLKCFAISKLEIQHYSSYGIMIIFLFLVILNVRLYCKDKIVGVMSLYLLSLLLSAIYIFSYVSLAGFLDSLLFPVLFLSSYIYFRKYPDVAVWMKYVGIIGVILAYFNLIRLSTEINLNATRALQSNAGNTLVALLPFVLLWKNKIIKYALFCLIFIGCLVALKRSAFIIYILVILFYFSLKSERNVIFTTIKYLAVILLIGFIVLPNVKKAQPMLERLYKSVEDGGSGRDSLIERGINFQSECSFVEWVIGTGYRGFEKSSLLLNKRNTCAHNDFVEILYDAGVITYILFLYLLWLFFNKAKIMYRNQHGYLLPFASCLLVFICANMFVCSFVHFWYYLPLYCLWGSIHALSS